MKRTTIITRAVLALLLLIPLACVLAQPISVSIEVGTESGTATISYSESSQSYEEGNAFYVQFMPSTSGHLKNFTLRFSITDTDGVDVNINIEVRSGNVLLASWNDERNIPYGVPSETFTVPEEKRVWVAPSSTPITIYLYFNDTVRIYHTSSDNVVGVGFGYSTDGGATWNDLSQEADESEFNLITVSKSLVEPTVKGGNLTIPTSADWVYIEGNNIGDIISAIYDGEGAPISYLEEDTVVYFSTSGHTGPYTAVFEDALKVNVYDEESPSTPLSTTISVDTDSGSASISGSSAVFAANETIEWVSIGSGSVVRRYYAVGQDTINAYYPPTGSTVDSYSFRVSNRLPVQEGDIYRVKRGSRLISTGVLPYDLSFSVWLIYGAVYDIEIIADGTTYTFANIPADDTTSRVLFTPAYRQTVETNSIIFSALRNETVGTITYTDGYNRTAVGSEVRVYRGNQSTLVGTWSLTNSTVITLTDLTNETYLAVFDVQHGVVGHMVEVRPLMRSSNPLTMDLPDLGFQEAFGMSEETFLALVILLIFAALMSPVHAAFGTLVISVMAAFFIWIGWLPLGWGVASAVVFIAFLAMIKRGEQGE